MSPDDNSSVLVQEPARPDPRTGSAGLTEAEQSLLQEVALRARAPLIIERPDEVLTARKLTNYALTFLWWSVWGHFALPLLTLLLWMSGFRRFSQDLLGHGGLDALLSRLPLYAAVVGILCGGLIGWALLNWWRFADRERRQFSKPLATAEVARSYGLAPDELALWQSTRRLVVLHDSQGRPTGVL
jgi:biofilm PGA synthesis protein PgaD